MKKAVSIVKAAATPNADNLRITYLLKQKRALRSPFLFKKNNYAKPNLNYLTTTFSGLLYKTYSSFSDYVLN